MLRCCSEIFRGERRDTHWVKAFCPRLHTQLETDQRIGAAFYGVVPMDAWCIAPPFIRKNPGPGFHPGKRSAAPRGAVSSCEAEPRISCCALHLGLRSVAPPGLFAIHHQDGRDLVASIYDAVHQHIPEST
jgi:hypothetical protein